MMQEIEHIIGRPVIYSLGNFIFKSNGKYRRSNVPPFSLLFQLTAKLYGEQIIIDYQLTPMFCANHECGFQPRPVSAEESCFLSEKFGFNFNIYPFLFKVDFEELF